MSFRSVLAREKFLTLPGAHDAISARLIGQAGFKAYFIGGFPLVGARFGIPDVGIAMLGEISAAVRDILGASDLPVMVDGDNGYGDVKSLVYAMHTYERLGVTALMFEDQVSPKRCGHIAGKDVIPAERMEAHIRAAVQNRLNKDTFILARTDARDVAGLDDALRRAERYLKAGADGLFVESPHDVDELTRIGRAFDVPQMANMLEGGRTPVLKPTELRELGFAMGVYGISLLLHSVHAMQGVLAQLKAEDLGFIGKATGFDDFKSLVGFADWSSLEAYYGGRK
jgi:2-methylisocitrate lyase-like PEP mutase family enzyme